MMDIDGHLYWQSWVELAAKNRGQRSIVEDVGAPYVPAQDRDRPVP
jgi:hypothetical protein